MIILAYGVPGSGKTTLLHDMVRLQQGSHLFYISDVTAEWGSDAAHWRGQVPSQLRVIYREDGGGDGDMEQLRELTSGVVVFRDYEPAEVAQFAVDRGNVTFVDDEIDMSGRRGGWDSSPLRDIVHRGRHLRNADGEHLQVNILGACRRPANLHTDLSELANEVFLFRLQGKNTIERLWADHHVLSQEEEDFVRTAPDFNFMHFPSRERLQIPPLGPRRD